MKPVTLPYCQICGRPIRKSGWCRICLRYGRVYAKCRSVGIYTGVLTEAVKSLKYRNRLSIAKRLGRMMSSIILADSDMVQVDVIIPVPLHRVRHRERGYNQALLLAKEISLELHIPLLIGSLVRVRYTTQQTRLARTRRRGNVEGAFAVTGADSIEGKRILLVDDVTTTGATLEECARALLDAGAAAVYCITAAIALT